MEETKQIHKKVWKEKDAHGYHQKQIEERENIDTSKTNNWMNNRFTSHIEGYICAMQEQEINTRGLRKRRKKDEEKKRTMNSTYGICHRADQTLFHFLCSSSVLGPILYLNMRHNMAARIMYQEIMGHEKVIYKPPEVTRTENKEIWWDISVSTPGKVEQSKPDMVLWDLKNKKCTIIEVTVPLDTNLEYDYINKQQKYMPLICQMQQLYRTYAYHMAVITIGDLGAVPKNLEESIRSLGIDNDRI